MGEVGVAFAALHSPNESPQTAPLVLGRENGWQVHGYQKHTKCQHGHGQEAIEAALLGGIPGCHCGGRRPRRIPTHSGSGVADKSTQDTVRKGSEKRWGCRGWNALLCVIAQVLVFKWQQRRTTAFG